MNRNDFISLAILCFCFFLGYILGHPIGYGKGQIDCLEGRVNYQQVNQVQWERVED